MAYSKTPAQSTYQTEKIALVKELNSRGTDTTKDEDFVNLIPELVKNKETNETSFKLVKREGTTSFISLSGTVRGCHYWKAENKLFFAISDDVYVYNASTGALITTLNTVFATTTSGDVGFCEFLYDTGAVKLVVTDGTTLSTIDTSNTVVAGADADMPVHLPYPVFLDGYLFIIKVSTADIYNSNLNNPLAYTAGDFISAEMRPDGLSYIAVLNNYILVFGNGSIEYFWDAAIASGSPLQRNDTPVKLTGFVGGLCKIANKLYFVGYDENTQLTVFMLDDFKIKDIGSEAIKRHLASLTVTAPTTTAGIHGSFISISGHQLYVLETGSATYALELESSLWTRLAFKAQTRFPINFALSINTPVGYKCLCILQSDTILYSFSPTLYRDNGTAFTCLVITDNEEFNTYRNKIMSKLVLWSSKTSSSSLLSISYADDDYQSFSTARTVDISLKRPILTQLGQFRQRAFKLSYTDNFPLILYGLEVDINMGIN